MPDVVTPDWVKDAIFYQIFPDRFARSNYLPKPGNLETWDSEPTTFGFKGGDLLGVAERLDYLVDLGITAIYFNPIFQSTANHRYHTYDYHQVDPLLGGNKVLAELLKAAHRRNIAIILDGVFNHASRGFFQFNDIMENGWSSPYLDWFLVKGFPLHAYESDLPPNYEAWWNLHALPKFNILSPAVRDFLWGVGEYWIRQGVDGWRLDVPNEITDDTFWQEFRRRVKGANPDAYLVGEIWGDARPWLQGDQFDAVMNYLLTKLIAGFILDGDLDRTLIAGVGYAPIPTLDAEAFMTGLSQLLSLYPPQATQAQLNLLGSHDTPRFLSIARGDTSALKLAYLVMMTLPGAPCIYYGDEIGMLGGKDPDCRRAFPWEEKLWNQDVRSFVQRCIRLRKLYPALRRGDLIPVPVPHNPERQRLLCYGRQLGEERLLIAINASSQTVRFSPVVTSLFPEAALLQDVDTGNVYKVLNGAVADLKFAPRSAFVLCQVGVDTP